MDKPPLSLLWLCKIIPFSQTLTDCYLASAVQSVLCVFHLLLQQQLIYFDLTLSSGSVYIFSFVSPPSYFAHCPISPSLFDFWLPAFTVLSSSRSVGEFATALPLQGAHSKSLSGLALITDFTLSTISNV